MDKTQKGGFCITDAIQSSQCNHTGHLRIQSTSKTAWNPTKVKKVSRLDELRNKNFFLNFVR